MWWLIPLCFLGFRKEEALPVFIPLKWEYRTVENNAFKPGEVLVFRVHYGWFTAGTATFRIEPKYYKYKGRLCYLIRGEGRSAKTFDWFYKVRDFFDTYVDKEGLFPHYYERIVNEGDFHYYDRVFFDHKNGIIKGKQGIFKTEPYTQDMLSAFYYARCGLDIRNAKPGTVYPMKVFMDDGVYDLGLKILGREVIKTPLGKFRCIKITPLVVVGRVFKGEEDMIMWVTDDENLIPVHIESPVIVGSIEADLIRYKNLRHPLTAKLD